MNNRRRDGLESHPTLHCSHTPTLRSFTLIELLVVVAIIAILASMLLPALKSARLSAKNAQFVSNLKQVTVAMHLYASDHGDRFISFLESTSGTTIASTHWHYRIGPYVNDPVSNPNYAAPEVIRRSLLHDPLDESIYAPWNRPVRNVALNGTSFGDEAWTPSYYVMGASNRKLASIQYPSELMLIGPGCAANAPGSSGTEWGGAARITSYDFVVNGLIDWYHRFNNGGSYAFADGHIEYKTKDWVYREAVKDHPSRTSRFFDTSAKNP
jgi:prepilin-type N-terminal cleavage/methylation domain-containing protein/prepilin-type processing-associated H-X9-DG protein